jgi:hypothetical protein
MNRLANFGFGLGFVLVFVVATGLAGVTIAADSSEKSVTGNLEDAYCYGTMGAKGPSHKECATKCASSGVPVILVEKGTDKSYIVLPSKNGTPLPDSVIKHMEDEVTVTGKEYSRNGMNYLVVESVK